MFYDEFPDGIDGVYGAVSVEPAKNKNFVKKSLSATNSKSDNELTSKQQYTHEIIRYKDKLSEFGQP